MAEIDEFYKKIYEETKNMVNPQRLTKWLTTLNTYKSSLNSGKQWTSKNFLYMQRVYNAKQGDYQKIYNSLVLDPLNCVAIVNNLAYYLKDNVGVEFAKYFYNNYQEMDLKSRQELLNFIDLAQNENEEIERD